MRKYRFVPLVDVLPSRISPSTFLPPPDTTGSTDTSTTTTTTQTTYNGDATQPPTN